MSQFTRKISSVFNKMNSDANFLTLGGAAAGEVIIGCGTFVALAAAGVATIPFGIGFSILLGAPVAGGAITRHYYNKLNKDKNNLRF